MYNSNITKITPELVAEISARVYAKLLEDLRIERERHRLHAGIARLLTGGSSGS